MDYDQDDLIAAMYQDDTEEIETEPKHVDPSGFRRSKDIHIGIVKYEVPTVEYVMRLEQIVMQQARIIEMQKHEISRLSNFMVSTRNFIRRQTLHLSEMQNNLDNKIDREAL